jgi:hypothetical protein
MPFDTQAHPEAIESAHDALPPLYAKFGFRGATMLHTRPDCDTMSWVMVHERTLAEGEVVHPTHRKAHRVVWTETAAEYEARVTAKPQAVAS